MASKPGSADHALFWASVASGTLSGLIVAWFIGLVGSIVALAALGPPGTEVKFAGASAFGALYFCLGVLVCVSVRVAFSLLSGATPPQDNRSRIGWGATTMVAGAFAAGPVLLFVIGSAGAAVGTALAASTVVLTLVVVSRPSRRVWTGAVWGILALLLGGTAVNAFFLGAIFNRALGCA